METGSLAKEVRDCPKAEQAYHDTVKNLVAGAPQEAITRSIRSQSGALVLWGGPKSGKTSMMLAMVLGHFAATQVLNAPVGQSVGNPRPAVTRQPILITASSDAAVDDLTRRLISMAARAGVSPEICLFKGSRMGSAKPKSENDLKEASARRRVGASSKEEQRLQEFVWDVVEMEMRINAGINRQGLRPHLYHNRKIDLFVDIACSPNHDSALQREAAE